MSSETPTEKKDEIVTPSVTPSRKSTFLGLGIDLNEPLWAGVTIVSALGLGYLGINFLKGIVNKPQQQPAVETPPVTVTIPNNVEEQRPLYQMPINHPPTQEELYLQSLNQPRKENNTNYYEQYYEAGRQHPDNDVTFVDNNDFTPAPQPSYQQPPRQVIIQDGSPRQQVTAQVPRPQPIEDSLAITDDQMDIDVKEIPAEFYNVGNVPKAFETIQQREEDPYDISNMEIDENTFKAMEANAIIQSRKNE